MSGYLVADGPFVSSFFFSVVHEVRYALSAERCVMGFFIHGCSVGSGSGLGYGV